MFKYNNPCSHGNNSCLLSRTSKVSCEAASAASIQLNNACLNSSEAICIHFKAYAIIISD